MKESYEPAVHWLTHEEAVERQKVLPVYPDRGNFSDPTADIAIGRVFRQQKKEQEEEQKKEQKKEKEEEQKEEMKRKEQACERRDTKD